MSNITLTEFQKIIDKHLDYGASIEDSQGNDLIAVCYHAKMKRISLAFEGSDALLDEEQLAEGWQYVWIAE